MAVPFPPGSSAARRIPCARSAPSIGPLSDVEVAHTMTEDADGPERILRALLDREVFGQEREHFDLDRLVRLAAGLDSAAYYAERMGAAARVPDAASLLRLAFARRDPAGLSMEFGVASGGSANLLAELSDGTIHGFDSFEGLPEDWRPGFPRGAFAHAIPALRPNVALEIGYFEETLPRFVARHR